ncbi:MAG TPA: GatB/YqeY domain-containing protein, partial [Acidobacteriota bacterium]
MLEKIQAELKNAMKQKDELRTSVLRMLLSDLKYAQIEKRAALDDADSIQVVRRAIKKRKESIDLYEKGGRPDLVQKETAELKILEEFAPAELD